MRCMSRERHKQARQGREGKSFALQARRHLISGISWAMKKAEERRSVWRRKEEEKDMPSFAFLTVSDQAFSHSGTAFTLPSCRLFPLKGRLSTICLNCLKVRLPPEASYRVFCIISRFAKVIQHCSDSKFAPLRTKQKACSPLSQNSKSAWARS